jgi:CRP-like cAMP-binding protein
VTRPASEVIAYPVLDDVQQARLRRYGTTRRVMAGEVLYSPADDSSDLLVVLSGEVVVSNDSLGRSEELAPDPGANRGRFVRCCTGPLARYERARLGAAIRHVTGSDPAREGQRAGNSRLPGARVRKGSRPVSTRGR